MNHKLDNEEQEILRSYEQDEWDSVPALAQELEQYRHYAIFTLNRQRSVNVRFGEEDFERIQQQAQKAGLTRETYIEHIVHQYIAGELIERS